MRIARHIPWIALAAAVLLWTGCDTTDNRPAVDIDDLVIGEGPMAEVGDSLTVHYSAWLRSGGPFLTTCPAGSVPFTFELGDASLVEGWTRGILGEDERGPMREQGIRRVVVPSILAWGPRGAGCDATGENCDVPPNEPVTFIIQLLEVTDPDSAVGPVPTTPCNGQLTFAPPPF